MTARRLTGPLRLLTGTLQVADMHFDQCSCGSLQVLQVQTPKGGGARGSPAPMPSRIPTWLNSPGNSPAWYC